MIPPLKFFASYALHSGSSRDIATTCFNSSQLVDDHNPNVSSSSFLVAVAESAWDFLGMSTLAAWLRRKTTDGHG